MLSVTITECPGFVLPDFEDPRNVTAMFYYFKLKIIQWIVILPQYREYSENFG